MDTFGEAYKTLNTKQKQAVDAIEGPVMVIAGPGTGKTQVLSLRIANILTKTDTPPDGILCLTFTNAGVKAMRERLMRYIGPAALRVKVNTFHSFALSLIEEFYHALDYDMVPMLLEDTSTVALFDELLHMREWHHVRPRSNPSMYFRDLKSLISTLKRDRITPAAFIESIEREMETLRNDPASISSRGETKGQIKKDVEKKLESFERSLEAGAFYALYEEVKNERGLIDYNDVLEHLVKLVEVSDDVRDTIRERYLYVLVDEHQDSSGIQNEFLRLVWADTEQPNLFVVGDDRQLIYGFGGASLSHFEAFTRGFGEVALITLTENYRSTQTVLDMAEALLQSDMAEGKLTGNTLEAHSLKLVEASYPRDEIILAGLFMQEKIAAGTDSNDCAILVPKNRQVKSAMQTLRDMGLPVAASTTLQLFELPEAQSLLNVLRVVANPFDSVSLVHSLLDPLSSIPPLIAHRFLSAHKKPTLETLLQSEDEPVHKWAMSISVWLSVAQTTDAYGLIQHIAEDCFLVAEAGDDVVRRRVEIVRTFLHLALSQSERGTKVTVSDFLSFIARLEEYNEDIPLAVFGAGHGIKVLTLHGSKGLEFDAVWIAHMDERSLMGSKRQAFALPEDLLKEEALHDESVKKRELYVAITRAKRFCTISSARHSYSGADQVLASVVSALPSELFEKSTAEESEALILSTAPRLYIDAVPPEKTETHDVLQELVREEYAKRRVSVTMLNNFFECTWKWYFRNLLQLPEPENESLHVGTVVHGAIEAVLKNGVVGLEETIETLALREARYDEVHASRLVAQATPIVNSWIKTTLPDIVAPYSTERALSYVDPDFAHLTLFGKIDLVEEIITDEVRVTDWKTGSTKTKADIEKVDEEGRMSAYLRQLAMYSYLLQGMTRDNTSVSESRLVFLEAKAGDKNAIVSRRIAGEEVAKLRQDIRDYDELAKTGAWMARPCRAKLYREGDVCEYCAMAHKYGVLQRISE
ncbi:MAG TPA: ATP-dependent DNA helicase [Candidatus Paceibacterota bacterium]